MSHHEYKDCIEACLACVVECENCATACLNETNVEEMVNCIQLDRDCASICALAAELMARGSKYAQEICVLCAKICRDCAKECEKHEQHQHCQTCAQACYRSAEACEKMAS